MNPTTPILKTSVELTPKIEEQSESYAVAQESSLIDGREYSPIVKTSHPTFDYTKFGKNVSVAFLKCLWNIGVIALSGAGFALAGALFVAGAGIAVGSTMGGIALFGPWGALLGIPGLCIGFKLIDPAISVGKYSLGFFKKCFL